MLKLVITSLILLASALHALTPDQKLAQDIHDRLSSGPKNYRHITVEVIDGVVILHGNVKADADKEKIEKAVRKINGVSKIKSQIKVSERKSDK